MLYAYVIALLIASKEIYYISSQNYFNECILMFSGGRERVHWEPMG